MMTRKQCPFVSALVPAVMLFALCTAPAEAALTEAAPAQAGAGSRPNFVFILIDDLRHDAMSNAGHPFVRTPNIDRIAAGGVRFTNAFVTTSLCGPSRASFLTGMYVHSHGVLTNEEQELDPKWPTFPRVLHENGYETAFVGKWHMGPTAQPRPGFDYWLSFRGQGVYVNPALNENGRDFTATGYMTDLLTQYAVDWLRKPRTKPFCLYLSHKAVHAEFTPAERHKDLYSDVTVPEPASYRDNLAGRPGWQRMVRIRGGQFKKPAPARLPDALPPAGPWSTRPANHVKMMDYMRALAAVDESVGRVLDLLKEAGQLGNTIVIFAGDNGFFHGEHHGMGDKRWAYEESIRIPLLVAGPGVPRGKLLDPMVLNVDVAPTILDLAGLAAPASVQGRSLKPLLAGGDVPGRESFLYEYYLEEWLPGVPTMVGVRTRDWKYVRYPEIKDLDELYDLKADPIEVRNLAEDPAAKPQLDKMKAELDRLCRETGRK
ncbi:MAG: sulfatase [Planctomycetes bacterium]|nr:sulfatase [Planctomycetota bacterium]